MAGFIKGIERDRNFTKGKIASRLAHLAAGVAHYIDEMVRIDQLEEGEARAERVAHLARRYGSIPAKRQDVDGAECRRLYHETCHLLDLHPAPDS
ncbi:hypothetical protein SAMN06265221_11459 [Paracoccus laeviglucosivorans]|uniref:Uncharacterized protein n=1 Tax=Paracoccus laeviglucosivorans TaxID=1197861 RepID=A0A521ENR6_9RHOB|nr:hypothetical protein SAMN06265221_11459 [Paracoccus laeviglucosivorans]